MQTAAKRMAKRGRFHLVGRLYAEQQRVEFVSSHMHGCLWLGAQLCTNQCTEGGST